MSNQPPDPQQLRQLIGQVIGALIVSVVAGWFLYSMVVGTLPGEDFRQDVAVMDLRQARVEHAHIALAIGSCHRTDSPLVWPESFLDTLRVQRSDFVPASAPNAPEAVGTEPLPEPRDADYRLTQFEQAAIYHSDRLLIDRTKYADEAGSRQLRARRNQIRILFVSAAAAFLVAMKTLITNKDESQAFQSVARGAVLPISMLAMLMPVIATALSGLVAFDDDSKNVVRHARTLAQLEQLHGRIAQDVTSDPFLCHVILAQTPLVVVSSTNGGSTPGQSAVRSAEVGGCLADRFQRTVAWEQRHEQILHDANQTLAQAGDLPRQQAPAPDKPPPVVDSRPAGAGKPQVTAETPRSASQDPCATAFTAGRYPLVPAQAPSAPLLRHSASAALMDPTINGIARR